MPVVAVVVVVVAVVVVAVVVVVVLVLVLVLVVFAVLAVTPKMFLMQLDVEALLLDVLILSSN